jgi:hypothetical protein
MKAVREFMRADLPESAASKVRIEAKVAARASGYAIDVRVQTPLGESQREIEARSCEQAINAAAIVVAVALDPLTVAEAFVEPAPAKPEPVEPPPNLAVGLEVQGVFDYGTLDAMTGGAAVGVFLGVGRLRFEARGTYLAPVVHRPFEGSTVGVQVQLGTAALRGCFVPAVRRLELPNCLWAEGGAARGRGVDVAMPRTRHDPWLAVGIGSGLMWWVRPHFALALHADGLAVLYRPKFVIDELGTAYQASFGAFRVAAGPAVRF